jgi:hypothetical protein
MRQTTRDDVVIEENGDEIGQHNSSTVHHDKMSADQGGAVAQRKSGVFSDITAIASDRNSCHGAEICCAPSILLASENWCVNAKSHDSMCRSWRIGCP